MQDTIDNELFRMMKFRMQDIAWVTARCLEKISNQEPETAQQDLEDLKVIFEHMEKSLKATDYTNQKIINDGMYWYFDQIKNI